ncbi:MAG: hypothetical protein M0D55_00860 [Elusimicrobiota bacterium]|nr:MAG: hypothetical protein M0D55_00860 [Elusimicrobiota bacterium]
MTRTTASLSALLALAPLAAAAAPIPSVPRGRVAEYEAAARVFARAGRLEPLVELHERWQFEALRPYQSMTLGSYGRAHRNLKLGAFYRVQKGARHDDDWTNDAAGRWDWRATGNRPESMLIVDATPRAALGKSLVAALKVRYEHNFFNGQRAVRLEPELAWFWLDGLTPRATVAVRHGAYLPLNFGQTFYYERSWYLAGLWHAGSSVSVGPTVALRDAVWSTSSAWRAASAGDSYRTLRRSVVWGLHAVIRAK